MVVRTALEIPALFSFISLFTHTCVLKVPQRQHDPSQGLQTLTTCYELIISNAKRRKLNSHPFIRQDLTYPKQPQA